jgi:hypothetical protein
MEKTLHIEREIIPGCSNSWEKNSYRVRVRQPGNTTCQQEDSSSPNPEHRPGLEICITLRWSEFAITRGHCLVRLISAYNKKAIPLGVCFSNCFVT